MLDSLKETKVSAQKTAFVYEGSHLGRVLLLVACPQRGVLALSSCWRTSTGRYLR